MYDRWGSNTRLICPGSRIDAAAPQPNLALPQCIGQQSLQIVDFTAPPWPAWICMPRLRRAGYGLAEAYRSTGWRTKVSSSVRFFEHSRSGKCVLHTQPVGLIG